MKLCRVTIKIDPKHEDYLNDGHWAMIEDLVLEIENVVKDAIAE